MTRSGLTTAFALLLGLTPLTLTACVNITVNTGPTMRGPSEASPRPSRASDGCVEQPIIDGKLRSDQVSVRVLNGSSRRGKAAEVSQQLKRQGFRVTRVGNAEDSVPETKVIGFSADSPEVVLVQSHFVGAKKAGGGTTDHIVVVVIGEDYQEMVSEAPNKLDVNTGTICLPGLTSQ